MQQDSRNACVTSGCDPDRDHAGHAWPGAASSTRRPPSACALAAGGTDVPEPLLDLLAESADPDLALSRSGPAGRRGARPARPAARRRPVLARQLIMVLGGSSTLTQHLIAHPEQLDLLDAELTQTLRRRAARGAAHVRRGRSRVDLAGGHRAAPETACGSPIGGPCCRSPPATCARPSRSRPWTTSPTSSPTSPTPRWKPRWSIARAKFGPDALKTRLAVIGLGKCGAQELNYVSDVDVLFVAEPVLGDDGRAGDQQRPGDHHRHPAGRRDDQDLLGPHRRRHDLGGRRRAAPGGQGGPARPHPGQPPDLLREVGQDLGVPGHAQGPAVRRRSRARRRTSSTWWRRWSGGPPSGRTSSPTPRRCASGWSPTSRPGTPAASSSSARAACATSSSPSSCCSWCTVGSTSDCGSGPRCRRSRPWSTTGTSAARTARDSRCRTGSCEPLEHRIQLFNLRRTHVLPGQRGRPAAARSLAGLRRSGRTSCSAPGGTPPSGYAGCTSGCSTPRCWTRWPGSRRRELRLTTDAALDRLKALGLRRPEGGAAAHRRAQPGRHPAGGDPAPAAAGDARLVRRRAQPRPRSAGVPAGVGGAGQHAVVPAGAARRGGDGRAAGPDPGVQPVRGAAADPGAADGADAGRRRRAAARGRWPTCRPRCTRRPAGRPTPVAAVEAIRAIRRRELFRVAAGDLLGRDRRARRVGAALTDLASATIDATLQVVRAGSEAQPVPRIAVIAMGRWGGREMSYASDADAMFVMEDGGRARRRPDQDRRGGDHRDAHAAGRAGRRPAAEHRRRPAARRQGRCADPVALGATATTTAAGRRPGSCRPWSGPTRWPAMPELGAALMAEIDAGAGPRAG